MGIVLQPGEKFEGTCRTCGQRIKLEMTAVGEDFCYCPYCGACTPYDEPECSVDMINASIEALEKVIRRWRWGGLTFLRENIDPRSRKAAQDLHHYAHNLANTSRPALFANHLIKPSECAESIAQVAEQSNADGDYNSRTIDRNSEEHHEVLDAMERFGGGFIQALAIAWRKADPTNHAKLMSQFGDYWQQYKMQLDQQRKTA